MTTRIAVIGAGVAAAAVARRGPEPRKVDTGS